MDIVQASVPLFFLLIGLELLVARVRRDRVYRLNDSVSDLSLGVMSQLAGIFIALATIALYAWVAKHVAVQRFLDLPEWISRTPFPSAVTFPGIGIDGLALLCWATVFVLDDLAYYWLHRMSHEVNVLWAGHVVHHSSEEYNLTVALRQSSLHGLLSWVFYMPLALLGIPVVMWVVCHGLNLIYQFWIHTREIDRLPGPLEAVLNTPSHHRVHHGVNPQYQDRNYAGVFIIWDRLFGTFEPEVEAPVYGITRPLASWNPVWANVHVFADILRTARRCRSWRDRWHAVFGHPGWKPAYLGPSERPGPVSPRSFVPFDPVVPGRLKAYAFAQFVAALVAAMALLEAAGTLPPAQTLAGVFYLVLTLSNVGAILEGRAWAALSELVRLGVLAVACAVLLAMGRGDELVLGAALLFGVASSAWILALRRVFPAAAPAAG